MTILSAAFKKMPKLAIFIKMDPISIIYVIYLLIYDCFQILYFRIVITDKIEMF